MMNGLLKASSYLYGAIMHLRNALFDRKVFKVHPSPIPVISIGNISAGGTGKTPLVDWVAGFLLNQGVRVAILSRGYGRSLKGVQLVSDGEVIRLNSEQAGDEPVMLAHKNKRAIVVVAERRKDGVEYLVNAFQNRLPQVIVLDDAFQHRQIQRHLDLAVVSANRLPIDDSMLPHGRLREPVTGLKRADLLLLSKVTSKAQIKRFGDMANALGKPMAATRIQTGSIYSCISEQKLEPEGIDKKIWYVFSGIGQPDQFLETLSEINLKSVGNKAFKDHYAFSSQDVIELLAEAEQVGATALITTEKDYYRLMASEEIKLMLAKHPFYYLKIGLEFLDGQKLFEEKILALIAKTPL